MNDLRTRERKLQRELVRLAKHAARRGEGRCRLPAGAPRKRVDSANALWLRAAEERGRADAELDAVRELLESELLESDEVPS